MSGPIHNEPVQATSSERAWSAAKAVGYLLLGAGLIAAVTYGIHADVLPLSAEVVCGLIAGAAACFAFMRAGKLGSAAYNGTRSLSEKDFFKSFLMNRAEIIDLVRRTGVPLNQTGKLRLYGRFNGGTKTANGVSGPVFKGTMEQYHAIKPFAPELPKPAFVNKGAELFNKVVPAPAKRPAAAVVQAFDLNAQRFDNFFTTK